MVGGKRVLPTLICPPRPSPSVLVSLTRPPRAPAGAVTDRVRSAILREAARLDITARSLLDLHARAEHLAGMADVVSDVEERYGLETRELIVRVERRAQAWA